MALTSYKQLLSGIDNFLFDVDGVFTNNQVLLYPGLDPVRVFHSRDAFAVQHAVKEGLRIVIVSGGRSQGAMESFTRLGVKDLHFSAHDKNALLDQLIAAGLDPKRTAYMGDDLPDLRVMKRVALPSCPKDAAEEIKAISLFIRASLGDTAACATCSSRRMKVQNKWMTDGAYTW
jgi:3-deoxy-D-manno-octulosonate 8-phosphate phosphatase (KDO 8-P phosphatase)